MRSLRFSITLLLTVLAACLAPVTRVYASAPPSTLHAVIDSASPPMAMSALHTTTRLASPYRSDSYVSQATITATERGPAPFTPASLLPVLVGVMLMGSVKTVAGDKDSKFALDSVRQQLNTLIANFNYFLLHRPAYQVAAAAVAPPVCATATVTSQVKTTATSQFIINGVPKSLTGTDNLWTLTGANLAAGFFRRYLLLWDGASATTNVTVQASTDAATAAGCLWTNLPAAGTVIVGILTIQNATNPFIPATTLLGAAGVTATYIDGIDDSVFLAAQVTP